jgi:hypothetical protein
VTLLLPPIGPLIAARSYLLSELSARENPLPVGIKPPPGEPNSYALLSRPGRKIRQFLGDYLIRVRVFDSDAVRLESNTDLLSALMLKPAHTQITIEDTSEQDGWATVRSMWVTGTKESFGPMDHDDPDVPLFGMQFATFWTIGLQPESLPGA